MKQNIRKGKYCSVTLTKNGAQKTFMVHRLVAKAFVPKENESYDLVVHKDKDMLNNRAENLCWKSSSVDKNKKVLCVETGKVYKDPKEAAEEFYVSKASIYRTCQGKQNTACGLHWRYV